MSLKESAIIDQIAESCRILGLLDITHAALGHVSHRMEGRDAMYIKGKGPGEVGLRYTTHEDVLAVTSTPTSWRGRTTSSPPARASSTSGCTRPGPKCRA